MSDNLQLEELESDEYSEIEIDLRDVLRDTIGSQEAQAIFDKYPNASFRVENSHGAYAKLIIEL